MVFILSPGSALAPEQGLLGAFSRFCMLLLKASCCISFCLSLPTCKMGLIPPTSLTSPSSSTQLGQVRSPGLLHRWGQGSESGCEGVRQGQVWTLWCSLAPSSCPGCLAPHDLKFRSSEVGQQPGREPSLGVSPGGQLSGRRGGARGLTAGRSLRPRWLYSDRSLLVVWNSILGETTWLLWGVS